MILERNTRLVMIGDSITDCGRNYDAPPAGWLSFGEGYVNLVNACLTGLTPNARTMVINKGISGNRIIDLKERWKKDVKILNPDWVSVMIGINDVWRHFDDILTQADQVEEEEFTQIYEELIQETLAYAKGMIIISPFMLESNREDPMRKMTDRYGAIGKKLAEKYNLIFVDVQEKMDEFMKSLPNYTLSSDRVHPNVQGHMIIAKAILDAIGFEWN